VLLVLCVLRPPEIHPEAAFGAGLLLPLAALTLAGLQGARGILASWTGPALYALALLALNFMFGVCLHAELRVLARLTLVAAVGAALLLVVRRGGAVAVGALAAGCGTAAALVALWQGLIGFSLQAAEIASSDSPLRDQVLQRLHSGRVFGTLLLPASLGGALAVTIPITIALVIVLRRPALRGLALVAALVQAAAYLWTFSLGAWGALLVAAGLVAVAARAAHRVSARRLVAVGVAAAAIIAAGFAVRIALLSQPGPEDRPLAWRAGNWAAASRMIADHPFLGTGLGTFGNVFPAYRLEGMNETRYAHCTWLQLIAEMGVGVVPLLILAALGGAGIVLRSRGAGALGTAGAMGAVSFLAHNSVDFTFYQPSVGVLFAAALGLVLGESAPAGPYGVAGAGRGEGDGAIIEHPPHEESAGHGEVVPRPTEIPRDGGTGQQGASAGEYRHGSPGARERFLVPATAALLVAVAGVAGLVLVGSGLADVEVERAGIARGWSPMEERADLAAAVRLDPLDPDIASSRTRVLGAGASDPAALAAALQSARVAVALDPKTAYRWSDLATIEARRGSLAEAWVHMSRASSLYPLKGEYRDGVDMLEKRLFPKSAGR
jgi:O-antigen ligase